MLDWLLNRSFMPHGHCYFWTPGILWLHVLSDGAIAFAYGTIPLTLWAFVRRRRDLAFPWMFALFGAFIIACGINHGMAVYTIWVPTYALEGTLKLVTAVVSVATAVLLVRLMPSALSLPSPQQLEQEIEERRKAEAAVLALNADLEARVAARTAELEAKNQDLRQFVQVVSHDLREPARTVSNFTQLLLEAPGELGTEQREFAEIAGDGATRLQHMLADLVRFARIGPLEVASEPLSLQDVAREVVHDLAGAARDASGTVQVDHLPAARGHRTAVYQVLSNLVANSLKYAGPAPFVRIGSEQREDGAVCIVVEDRGPGIPEAARERIFEMFERLHTTDEAPGTGVGLALARRMARSMGGDLLAEDGSPGGARMVLVMPSGEGARESRDD